MSPQAPDGGVNEPYRKIRGMGHPQIGCASRRGTLSRALNYSELGRNAGYSRMACCSAVLPLLDVVSKQNCLRDLAHGFAALPAFSLHGTVCVVLAQRQIALQNAFRSIHGFAGLQPARELDIFVSSRARSISAPTRKPIMAERRTSLVVW